MAKVVPLVATQTNQLAQGTLSLTSFVSIHIYVALLGVDHPDNSLHCSDVWQLRYSGGSFQETPPDLGVWSESMMKSLLSFIWNSIYQAANHEKNCEQLVSNCVHEKPSQQLPIMTVDLLHQSRDTGFYPLPDLAPVISGEK